MPIIPFAPVNTAPTAPAPVNTTAPAVPAQRARNPLDKEQRRMMIAKVKVAQKQLGMDDATYRAMLDGLFGVDSCTRLNAGQLHQLILHLQQRGWQARRGSARRGANRKKAVPANLSRSALMGKIEALLAEKGRVEGTHMPWAYAVGILKKQTHGAVVCLEHALESDLKGVIAALIRDAKRKGRYVEEWGTDTTDYEEPHASLVDEDTLTDGVSGCSRIERQGASAGLAPADMIAPQER